MYELFSDIYGRFEESGVKDPLAETLKLVDILTEGAVRGIGLGLLDGKGLSLDEVVGARKDGRPLEYIIGEAPFMGRLLICEPGALIPRQETELLTSTCISIVREVEDGATVIEIGTGSGNIAVSIAMAIEDAKVYAADVSEEAVDIAARNVKRYGLEGRVSMSSGDLFDPMREAGLEGKAHLVVCNPPYIPTSSLEKMASEIVDYEPVVALDAGAYGIDIFRRLIAESPGFLRPGGSLAFEIGAGQDKFVERLFKKAGGWEDIRTYDDGEAVRVFTARKA
ncbi:MAG TPA: peptide chain release factor N(5)-glutamine methyltransferase [Candidatus Krumholzibacterium sp.]|nr:peptide chain release factor N(5)-glutamine methyltransferase [Candidatus Krumholzibacterium sp.]